MMSLWSLTHFNETRNITLNNTLEWVTYFEFNISDGVYLLPLFHISGSNSQESMV